MMEYELCVKKKMTALFEYLDVNGDGKITLDCLHNGLISLSCSAPGDTVCEFELEEILRCIPRYTIQLKNDIILLLPMIFVTIFTDIIFLVLMNQEALT